MISSSSVDPWNANRLEVESDLRDPHFSNLLHTRESKNKNVIPNLMFILTLLLILGLSTILAEDCIPLWHWHWCVMQDVMSDNKQVLMPAESSVYRLLMKPASYVVISKVIKRNCWKFKLRESPTLLSQCPDLLVLTLWAFKCLNV